MTYPPKDYYNHRGKPPLLRCTIEHRVDADGIGRPTITELKPMGWLGRVRYSIRQWFSGRDLSNPKYTWDDIEKLEYAIDVDAGILTQLIDPALREHEQIKLVLTPTECVIHATAQNELKDKDPRV